MAELLDLFDDPPPEAAKPPPAAAPEPPARVVAFDADAPCARPHGPGYRCRVGGGHAYYSDDGGRSWFCSDHRSPGFLPGDRR